MVSVIFYNDFVGCCSVDRTFQPRAIAYQRRVAVAAYFQRCTCSKDGVRY